MDHCACECHGDGHPNHPAYNCPCFESDVLMKWYDSENVRLEIEPDQVFVVQRISIAGKMVELSGPLRIKRGDRIHLSLIADETLTFDLGRDEVNS